MRSLLLFLICLPVVSFASYTTKKTMDGAVATCDTKDQINRNFLGVYKAEAKAIEVYNGQVIISLDLDFLACNQLGSDVFFVPKSPYEPLVTPLGVDVTIEDVRLKAVVDGKYKLLVDSQLGNASQQSIQVVVPVSEVVVNKSNQANLDLWITKDLVWKKGEIYSDSTTNFGIFRVHFTLQNVQGEYQANLQN